MSQGEFLLPIHHPNRVGNWKKVTFITTRIMTRGIKIPPTMKTAHFKTGRRDANEKFIQELLNRRNVKWTQFKPGDGADLLIWIAPMELWEVKDPSQPPSKRELTDDENEARDYCKSTGIPYIVIETVEDANLRLNLFFDKNYLR